jgi:hypothetical protein
MPSRSTEITGGIDSDLLQYGALEVREDREAYVKSDPDNH